MANNKNLSEEERLELASKLDKDLENFMENLESKPYKDGWNPDTWEQEMDSHPFFMKELPKDGQELHPLVQGLQKLKYDPEYNTNDDLALSYKEDGNFNFKYKKYHAAIASYTEGLKAKAQQKEVNVQLFTNRAACHWYLSNIRSSLKDCEAALKIDPYHLKAIIRGAQCLLKLKNFKECLSFCSNGLSIDHSNEKLMSIEKQCFLNEKEEMRNIRKKNILDKKQSIVKEKLIEEIKKREISVNGEKMSFSYEDLCPKMTNISHKQVHLDGSNNLLWPVFFLYPEYNESDFIEEFNENDKFIDHLEVMFGSNIARPTWDKSNVYHPHLLKLFFECKKFDSPMFAAINSNDTLLKVLKNKYFILYNGLPQFLVFSEGSDEYNKFLSTRRIL